MESHSPVFAVGAAASVVSLENERVMPARQGAFEARNGKLFNAFVYI
jgi:hypothetical protein